MEDCRRTGERLTPYVDEALPPEERRDVERHLDRCPPCRRSAQEEQGARTVVRERADRLRHSPLPPGLRSRCEALAAAHCRGGANRSWTARLIPAALGALIVAVVVMGVMALATRRSGTVLAAQLAADHVKCFKAFAGDQPTDAADVERELEDRYGWDMHVPPSSRDAGVELVGGRRCLYAEGTLPHVMYRADGATPVSLFRLEGGSRDDAEVTTLGHRCRIWSRGGYTYAIVTPASSPHQEREAQLVQYLRREAR